MINPSFFIILSIFSSLIQDICCFIISHLNDALDVPDPLLRIPLCVSIRIRPLRMVIIVYYAERFVLQIFIYF